MPYLSSLVMLAWGLVLFPAPLVSTPTSGARTVQAYTAKNFDHLLGKASGFNDDLLTMHLNLYRGYVANTNAILATLRQMEEQNEQRTPQFAGLKRILGWEMNGMLLHEYYFENLGGSQPLDSSDPLFTKIQADFGSFDAWKRDLMSTGLMRGVGWVITYVEPKEGRLVNMWINEHDGGHLSGAAPLLVMDVFEHAFLTQFGLDRAKYLDVFFNNIDWKKVSGRYGAFCKCITKKPNN